MFRTVMSASVFGVESRPICVEADVGEGLPSFTMVGYLSAQVKEAQDRVRTALKNAGFQMRPKRITVNLSPADLRKSGAGFDLPIAVAVAAAYGEIPQENLQGILIAGELSLNGEVLAVPGILPIAAGARENGCGVCIVPKANEQEGALIENVKVIGVTSLKEAIGFLKGSLSIAPASVPDAKTQMEDRIWEDFADINGQETTKRAVEVAVSGFHNFLMIGPPGAGKSMVARRIAGILPPLCLEESLEISGIYSTAGLLAKEELPVMRRPFRAPHHTITAKGMAGGGSIPKPGEVSLAHNGVLFLDELPEFTRDALEILRQPLENREVVIARAGFTYRFPANFMLAAAMNPCPCGHYPDVSRCACTPFMVQRYLSRVSSPLLDRIDITVETPAVGYQSLKRRPDNEPSEKIRARVMRAREIQRERYRGTGIRFNADLNQQGIEQYCRLEKKESRMMREAFDRLNLSARTYYRLLKVSRTIADLAGCERIEAAHLQEALCYRSINKRYWL